MQALYCRVGEHGDLVRYCTSHRRMHSVGWFYKNLRSCDDYLEKKAQHESDRIDKAIATQYARAAASRVADAATEEPLDLVGGRCQEEVVDGVDAVAQLRVALGGAISGWVHTVTGCDDATDEALVTAISQLEATAVAPGSVAATELPEAPLPRTCTACERPTLPQGFAGRSICMLCFATGKYGLSLIDVNYILVTGLLTGEGVPLQTLPRCVCLWRGARWPLLLGGVTCIATTRPGTSRRDVAT